MKKLSIILILLLALSGCGQTYAKARGSSGPRSARMSYGEALALCDTPQAVADWMMYAISYKEDVTEEDQNKTPEQTVADRAGDCEDFAILAQYMLRRHGWKAEVLFTFPTTGDGHAVCAIKHAEESYSYISNSQYIPIRYNCYADIAGRFYYPGRWYIWRRT